MIGVLTLSSLMRYAGVPGRGLRISEGYEAETGVWRVDRIGLGLDSLSEAMAVAVEETRPYAKKVTREAR